MEEKIEEKKEDIQEIAIDNKPKNKIESITDWVLLGLIVVAVVVAGIWLGLGAEKRIGGAIQQKFIKTEKIALESVATPTPGTDNSTYYQSKKAEILGRLFIYPGSTVGSRKQDANNIFYVLQSSDPAETVTKYYRDLIALNSWKTVRVGGDTSVIKITQSDFSALVEIDILEGVTTATVDIDFSDPDTITSTFTAPERVGDTVVVPPYAGPLSGDYVLPFSGTRIVNNDDLAGLTPWELKVARNEIYARYGRSFVHKDLSCYFAKQSWYSIDPDYSDVRLSKIDVKNASLILNFEKSINSPLVAKDSGCK